MTKKILTFLLACVLLFSLSPFVFAAEEWESVTDSAPEIIAEGSAGEAVFWKLDSNGCLTICGEGPVDNAASNGHPSAIPWFSWKNQILSVVVEDGVTTLPDYAFYHYPVLSSLDIADSVAGLGYRMCENATSLSHVSLPSGITDLPFSVFQNTGLTSIDIPQGVTGIDGYAFAFCDNLKEVVLPDSIISLGASCFWNCDALEIMVIPDSVTSISGDAFDGCSKLTIHGYQNTHAHLFARERDIPFEILEERPETVSYPILVHSNPGGIAQANAESSPAGRFIDLELTPEAGYHLGSVDYFFGSDHAANLEYEWISDTLLRFPMPACAVGFEITFLINNCPFRDVSPEQYYHDPVLWAVSKGITAGVSETRFAPDQNCTRAQVVTFLWRAAGSPEPALTENPFRDVTASSYYYDAVLWALENHITSGTSPITFGPDQNCTRAQVVTFLWRSCGAPPVSVDQMPFIDVHSDAYYRDAVLWANAWGITSGTAPDRFSPNDTCTRGQIVTFLYRSY